MVTLRELLKNPIFSSAKVVAGANGLSNPIEWSHIIDLPDVVDLVGEGPQLIITTGQGIPHEPDAQAKFITDMATVGLSGVLISVGGQFLSEIPASMLDAANDHSFPIVVVPPSVRFIDITKTIHEQLVSEQYALLKRSDHIHQTLVQLVLEGGGLQDLAMALSKLVDRAVTIEDPDLNMLAHAGLGEIDKARADSIEAGGTPESIREFVRSQKILDKLNQSLKPSRVLASPKHGMTKERIVAPIVVERKIYGYLWLIASDEPLNESDTVTIERAAIVAALIMLKESAIKQTEARLQADVISQLLSDQPHSLALEDKANRLGLNLEQSQQVMLVRPPAGVLPSLRLVDKLTPEVSQYTKKSIVQPFGVNLILIIPEEVDARALAYKLVEAMSELKIGVGNIATALTGLAESYRQAKEALEIGVALSSRENLFFFEDLGYLHWLYHQPLVQKNGNRFAKQIQRLVAEERAERAQLLQTLDAFLDLGGNAAETARVLNIHRNTLSYRLKQIESYCEVSLSDPVTRLNLQIAIKAYQLSQTQKES